ncbi:FMN-binding glutamate synthase family protein [Ferrimonas balearica]|uniref:FMN-binding glutamate synthase family protein n=1 Tax=Ferrimonas balearica TaxID=44012 RepID=UPI001C9905DA|nr:FMN-binding glutamate synthase family protein [Ferrimonas balearica]MBY5990714.1 FMN-binding glutamate synthase family protein [Ferrimonas balearica]
MSSWAFRALELSAALFVFLIGSLMLLVLVLYVRDVTQTRQAIRRNYPVVGRFRYWFEHMGEFFRQYFFAQDREEMPFNRAQRSWVYRAAKDLDATVAFGSTRPLNQPGDIIFLNCLLPTLKEDAVAPEPIHFGQGHCRTPYTTTSFFNVSGMSFGALSVPAVRALSLGAAEAGVWLNTGEGGLSPYHLEGGGDIVFQIGTAKYGVRDAQGRLSDERLKAVAEHPEVKMFELKLSQGAKPGKGGILPGEKVTEEIAQIRGIPVGQDSISPNGHPEIRSVEDLLDLIQRIREVTGKPVGFKAVLGSTEWLDSLASAIQARGLASAPDFITLDSADGGTGAAPQSLMDFMGLPIRRSLPLLIDWRERHGLAERVRVVVSGKLINPSDVAWALCVGADAVASARGFMFALGCIQALQCNKNSCPTGITTHDPKLQKGLVVTDKSHRVAQYARNLMHEVGVIAHSCGVKGPHELRPRHAMIIDDHGLPVPLARQFPPKMTGQD